MFYDFFFIRVLRLLLLPIILGVTILFFSYFINSLEVHSSSTCYIQSAVLNDSTSGFFVLGTGVLDGTTYFVTYEIQDDGGKVLRKYDSSDVIVYDDIENGDCPFLVKTMSGFLGSDFKVCFHVPKGTVNKSLDINLKDLK